MLEIRVMEKTNLSMHSGWTQSAGMPVDAQANHGNSPVHVQCFFPLKKGSR